LNPQNPPGITANNRFYAFSRHFLERKDIGEHRKGTDECIISTLNEPDHVLPPQGNRTEHWKKFQDPDLGDWWLLVVIADEAGGPQVLTAYEETTRGERL